MSTLQTATPETEIEAPPAAVPTDVAPGGTTITDAPPDVIKMKGDNVDVFYGDKQALFGINLDIGERQVTSLIGPSGCGKSTFLRCLNRMNDTIDIARMDGTITLGEQDIYDPSIDVVELRARVGMIFQKPNPFPKSIFENIAYGPRIHGLADTKSDLEEVVVTSLQKAGLFDEVKDRLDAPGTGLSGGQQQRLCIARAIATSPEVLLMDEPCSALDPIATAKVEELIDELRENFTVVIVTHSMQQAGACLAAHRVLPSRHSCLRLARPIRFSPTRATPAPAITLQAASASAYGKVRQQTRTGWRTNRKMNKHIVTAFDTDLSELLSKLTEMAGWVERSVEVAVDALMTGASEAAEKVIEDDDQVDQSDRDIESDAVLLIAKRQPMGDDLRIIVSTMRVSQDLERVGDLAKNIAKRALIIDGSFQQRKLAHGVDNLARLVLGQLKHSLEAFVELDTDKATEVWRHDAEVDALYTSLFRELLTYMMEDPRNISACTHLLFCAKNLERIGDHATNIAERAVYNQNR